MADVTVFKQPYCEIVERENGVLYAKWMGFLKPDEVRAGCAFMTDLIKEKSYKVHLSDHRDLKVLSKDVQDYLVLEWFPEVESIGMVKVAALVSPDVFAKATVEKVNNEAKVGFLSITTFGNEEDCLNWLLN
ncbi:hypothetical protein SAMN05421780_11085 [Flexibacter flexilis DSM 6793]|uniref:SpoIIAA-like n=1 Tax=Flexibacter flexilis DSM 6793 TaxID=927664 RepID=A0A1I1MGZ6_9BACT|nr:hypothetical protein [Flexibacter flexilis]SFC81903.1 hypothetical protein SAMN05421780_11085 [Flexibacter flexilis DSM 6793]